jgi:hypothetical protein
MPKAPFPIIPELTGIAIAYRNRQMIADQILPRITPVTKEEFIYFVYDLAQGFTVPDTKVGRRGKVNQIEFTAKEETGYTKDYGLEDSIPSSDLANAPTGIDPRANSVEYIMNLLALDREVRVAGVVFNPDTYPAANKLTLSGTSQFSDKTSHPIQTVSDALDSCVVRPNVMVIGRPAWSVLSRHPEIVSACLRNAGESGIARRQDVADLFELEEIVVGEAFVNNARKGQTPTLSRCWGKHLSLIYRNRQAAPQRDVTFGMTVPFGQPVAGAWESKNIGLRGGTKVRAGESVEEIITCADCGYFLQNVA